MRVISENSQKLVAEEVIIRGSCIRVPITATDQGMDFSISVVQIFDCGRVPIRRGSKDVCPVITIAERGKAVSEGCIKMVSILIRESPEIMV